MKNIYTNLYKKANILGLSANSPRLIKMIELTQDINLTNKKILDFGCNDGTFLSFFKNKTSKLYGLDGSPQAIKRCHKKNIIAKEYFFDDKAKIPFKTNSFDLVIAGEIIEHVYDTDYFLAEIARVLKNGGHLLLSTPNIASLGRRIYLLLGKNPILEVSPNYKESCGHIRYFTKLSLEYLFSHHRFSQIKFSSDIVNLTSSGKIYSTLLAKLFPSIGQSLISLYKKN